MALNQYSLKAMSIGRKLKVCDPIFDNVRMHILVCTSDTQTVKYSGSKIKILSLLVSCCRFFFSGKFYVVIFAATSDSDFLRVKEYNVSECMSWVN